MHQDQRLDAPHQGQHPAPTRRVVDLLVILPSLKVRQRREQPGRVGHDLKTAIDELLVEKLLERPPDALHEAQIECLVVIVKVDPAAHALDSGAPLARVAHHDRAALCVVLVNAHREHVPAGRDPQLLVDLVLDGHAVRVPAKAARHVEARDVCVARDDVLSLLRRAPPRAKRTSVGESATVDEGKVAYLDCSGKEVTIMRQPGSKRRPVVKGVYGTTFGKLEARLERVNLAPKFQYFLLLLWEVKRR